MFTKHWQDVSTQELIVTFEGACPDSSPFLARCPDVDPMTGPFRERPFIGSDMLTSISQAKELPQFGSGLGERAAKRLLVSLLVDAIAQLECVPALTNGAVAV